MSGTEEDAIERILNVLSDNISRHPKGGGPAWSYNDAKAAIQSLLAEARNKTIDDCISVIRSKQYADAEELAKRMAKLVAQGGKSDE